MLPFQMRFAAFDLPCVMRTVPWRPLTHVICSQRILWHSSGLTPVSNSTTETACKSGCAQFRYSSCSCGVNTLSRQCSPARNLTRGAFVSTFHSSASRRTRRRQRRQLFTELALTMKVASVKILPPKKSHQLALAEVILSDDSHNLTIRDIRVLRSDSEFGVDREGV